MNRTLRQFVLNVDGNEASRQTSSRALRAAGIEVEEAGSAAEAFAALQRKPQVVLFGEALRDSEACGVRRLRDAVSVPVVQVGDSSTRDGADVYVAADCAPEDLVAAVYAMLRLEDAERTVRDNEH